MEMNFEVYQNSTSFQQKEADKPDLVVRNVVESIINNVVSASDSLNQRNSESDLINSLAGTSEEHEILKNEPQKRGSSNKLKALPSKENHLKVKISIEDYEDVVNNNVLQKTGKISDEISKASASEKNNLMMMGQEDSSVNLSELKNEEKAILPKRKVIENKGMEEICNRTQDIRPANENLKEAIPGEGSQLKELFIKRDSGEAIGKHTLSGISEMEECSKNNVLSEEKNEDGEMSVKPNEDAAFSNYLDIKIPRIGKHVFQNEEGPLKNCYDLAIERNEKRFKYMRETGIDDEILKLVDEEANMSESEKKEMKVKKQKENIEKAYYVTELCAKILEELVKERPNEKKIIYYFMKFLDANVTPTCLLYVPHFVHTMSFIRGRNIFRKETRLAANECYNYCHAMFPIPFGYNFETVYTSEMQKFLPDDFDKMENRPLDYGGIDDILENSDEDDYDEDDDDSSDNISLL